MPTLLDALRSTLVEILDSKKALASITSVVAAALVLAGGRLKISWLDPDTANLIAGAIVLKGSVYVLAQAHVDAKTAGNERTVIQGQGLAIGVPAPGVGLLGASAGTTTAPKN